MSAALQPLFAGLKVVDAATWIAAPVAATILGDLGADVIKVEIPGDGDPYRALARAPLTPDSPHNYCWMMDARNKRSLTLNLRSEQGREVLHRLVNWCDVYITNQPLGMRRRLGLGYENLGPLNPRMIFASLTAYGETGEEADREGFDGVAYWTRSGLADLVRAPGAPPGQAAAGMGDHPTGVALYAGIVTALYRRQATGQGGLVHTSLLANGFWSNGCMGQAALVGADFSARERERGQPPSNFVRALYECADGRFAQLNMVRTPDEQLAALHAIGGAALAQDPRFVDLPSRQTHGAELVAILRGMFARQPAKAWVEQLHAAGVPASWVATVQDMADDRQAIANRVLVRQQGQADGPWIINHPIHVEGVPSVGATIAPAVGEHTEEILAQLGYTPGEVADLRLAQAV